MKAVSGDRARRQRPALEAVGLGAEDWRVSLLRWIDRCIATYSPMPGSRRERRGRMDKRFIGVAHPF